MHWAIIVSIIIVILYVLRKYFKGGHCQCKHSLKGKTIIVTGASSGIGKEAVYDLVKHGANVILACRNEAKTYEAMKGLTEEQRKLTKFIRLDLCDFDSVFKFSEQVKKEYPKIDILMNNAGLFPQQYQITKDGMECNLQGNFTGHFLLTFLLFDHFDKNDARIINLSSIAIHGTDFHDDVNIQEMYDVKKSEEKYFKQINGKIKLYSNTKLLMLYFSKFLAKLCENKFPHIKSAALHPGAVYTDFLRFFAEDNYKILNILFILLTPFLKWMMKSPSDGAETQLNLCYLPFGSIVSGAYYSDCKIKDTNECTKNFNKINNCMRLTVQELKKRFPDLKELDILN